MKTLLIIISLLLIPIASIAATDFKCSRDCQKRGYSWSYCNSQCSYNTPSAFDSFGKSDTFGTFNKRKRTDYQCQSDCTSKGYMFSYCSDLCSY